MYHDKIALTMQSILEKEFKVDARGYRMQEVDQFLDISNQKTFLKVISILTHLIC